MEKTIIYLIRHSEQLRNKGSLINNADSDQLLNEKIILNINGEKLAEKLAQNPELQDVDIIYSSNYVRAISTAKYISSNNNLQINIDPNFGERKLGNLADLEELGKTKKYSYTTEQILDENLKNIDGESRNEATKRFFSSFNSVLTTNKGKKVVIVSHGAIIKFALLKWCNFNTLTNCIEYKNVKLAEEKLSTPCIFKLEFEDDYIKNISYIPC